MNIEIIEQIVSLISTNPVSEITVEQDGQRVHVRKPAAPVAALHPPHTGAATVSAEADETALEEVDTASPAVEEEPILLTSPMVGLFHHRTQPIPYGGLIASGQVVGSIESMKLLNDVVAEQGGRVVEVLIEDGAPVEYGQPLFRLAPP